MKIAHLYLPRYIVNILLYVYLFQMAITLKLLKITTRNFHHFFVVWRSPNVLNIKFLGTKVSKLFFPDKPYYANAGRKMSSFVLP